MVQWTSSHPSFRLSSSFFCEELTLTMAEADEISNLTCSDIEDHPQHHTKGRPMKRDSIDSLRVSHNDDDKDEYDDRSADEDTHFDPDESDTVETIALFGVDSRTGHHFLRLALDAGYRVRALVEPNTTMDGQFQDLYIVVGTLSEHAKIRQVLHGSTYAVCMVGETALTKLSGGYPKRYLLQFVKTLYRIMAKQEDPSIQGFLFQATSLAANQWGEIPAMSTYIRKYWTRQHTLQYVEDLDAVIRYIHSQSWGKNKASFPYIITRPTSFLRDGRSTKKLQASKSQPGPFPYCNVDLAEYTLNALTTPKLYNTCRYVVGDGC
ncbi:Inherit from NOG: NmrA-like family [Seminavis robusta]|uniref:Inherit from NOG: NmrA-like family n=1 Tax=Seminavis robusta TaxID=568900 RepID=A0A9N8ENN6_9STRA|nr:Inherit from NOG: NmrA-like family [Seminavis robusta]|eukprot:Sro1541_g280970.1 Inherit from NOG: NmrA-like family (322) ;mRNA; f:24247-25329